MVASEQGVASLHPKLFKYAQRQGLQTANRLYAFKKQLNLLNYGDKNVTPVYLRLHKNK